MYFYLSFFKFRKKKIITFFQKNAYLSSKDNPKIQKLSLKLKHNLTLKKNTNKINLYEVYKMIPLVNKSLIILKISFYKLFFVLNLK